MTENLRGHLAYYKKHGISPVRYAEVGHAERMESLLRQLKVLPAYFAGRSVLEVAAGSGQTAQYIASLNPSQLTLVEPNPTGYADIISLNITDDHWNATLEDFNTIESFDVVVCQNWLGSSAHERGLLKKLCGLVSHGGILLITCMSETGMKANGLRREIAERLLVPGAPFDEQVAILVAAFGPHLATMKDMTRSHEDWVKDNMLNPAWAGIGLTLPMLINDIGGEFDILGTSPDFIEDWRWFKSLTGERGYNAHALAQIAAKDRWFLDYRIYSERDVSASIHALREAYQLLERTSFTVEDVANMQDFSSLFGRETIHVSLTKK